MPWRFPADFAGGVGALHALVNVRRDEARQLRRRQLPRWPGGPVHEVHLLGHDRAGRDGTLIEKQILDLPHASYELTLEIALDERPALRTARWRQMQGALDFNEGAWVVEEEGDRTLLRYQVAAALHWLPQGPSNYVLRWRLARLLEAVEQRVRDLEAREPEYFGHKD